MSGEEALVHILFIIQVRSFIVDILGCNEQQQIMRGAKAFHHCEALVVEFRAVTCGKSVF